MATVSPIVNIQDPGTDLAKKTVFIKLHLGLLGNSRKVSSSQVEVDADKSLIRVSKNLIDSPELQAIRTLDGDIRRYLYETCLPFEVGIHLLPLARLEIVDGQLREFKAKRSELVEVFVAAYPRLAMRLPAGCARSQSWSTTEGRGWGELAPAHLRLSRTP